MGRRAIYNITKKMTVRLKRHPSLTWNVNVRSQLQEVLWPCGRAIEVEDMKMKGRVGGPDMEHSVDHAFALNLRCILQATTPTPRFLEGKNQVQFTFASSIDHGVSC